MSTILFSLLGIYGFVAIGFAAKKVFGEQIHERSFTLLSVNFFQPVLIFWGILLRPLDFNLVIAPIIFMSIVVSVFGLILVGSLLTGKSAKERSLISMGSVLGNSGTLGITTGLVLLGPESVPYTSMMNLINIIFCFSVGAYIYSRGSFSIQQSIHNVIRLPIIWAAFLAIAVNATGIELSEQIQRNLEIGAHTSIGLQLALFGMYLATANIRSIRLKLTAFVSTSKLLILPLVGLIVLQWIDLPALVKATIIIELMVPMAVNNINLASLYNCEPKRVTEVTFATSILFIVTLPLWAVVLSSF